MNFEPLNLAIIGWDYGLSPAQHNIYIYICIYLYISEPIGLLLLGALGIICSEIWIQIKQISHKKMQLKMQSENGAILPRSQGNKHSGRKRGNNMTVEIS